MPDTLRALPLFESLSDDQLAWLLERAIEVEYGPGDIIFREGDPSDAFWVLLEGEWRLTRDVGGLQVEFVSTRDPGTWAGGGAIGDGKYPVNAEVLKASRFMCISNEDLRYMLAQGFPIAPHLLDGLRVGAQGMAMLTLQHEKLTALGRLSAGLAHELNNPATAAQRTASYIRTALWQQQFGFLKMLGDDIALHWQDALARLRDTIRTSSQVTSHDPLVRADREDALIDWLEGLGLSDVCESATTLADGGVEAGGLDLIVRVVPEERRSAAARWLVATLSGEILLQQLEASTARISDLVESVKAYTYMDQAPIQDIDVHEGLESTLTMLGHELGREIRVVREYDPDLPRICAYGSELNQVWTNLIDNAIDAMSGQGTLRIRTARDVDMVLVEIGDDGAGIPEAIRSRIFDPFFTTKGVGEGAGLGLDLAYRVVVHQHHGDVRATSKPGDTVFQVRLPIEPPIALSGAPL